MRKLKRLLTKNGAIALLLSVNLSAAAYIVATKKEPPKQAIKVRNRNPHGTIETAAILKNDEKLQQCYQRYLEKSPAIDSGSVKLHMTIKYSGEIDYLKLVESDIPDQEFTECIVAEVKNRKVTPTKERLGVLISHKFNFSKRSVSSVNY